MTNIERQKIASKIRGALKERNIRITDIARSLEPQVSDVAVHHVINGFRNERVEEALIRWLKFDPWALWCKPEPSKEGAA